MSGPTIRDVAERAGVSLTTVSYVLSGRSGGTTRISRSTQERVMAAVDDPGTATNRSSCSASRGGNSCWPAVRTASSWASCPSPRKRT
ncbi:LacI family DNA-binding transcriptional regulator [Arthrobacter sp. SAFR-014]|uniref:LacI family DNA-binding transcriptional regulator n=1 Tax=unclassified Arthrobacter TaxID=235627 RepID=UPI003F7CAC3B